MTQRSVYLGQFTDEMANEIAGALSDANIPWHFKQSGSLGKALFAGDWGTRLFVEAEFLDQAKVIAEQIKAAPDSE